MDDTMFVGTTIRAPSSPPRELVVSPAKREGPTCVAR
jgi:hypothetical protein